MLREPEEKVVPYAKLNYVVEQLKIRIRLVEDCIRQCWSVMCWVLL